MENSDEPETLDPAAAEAQQAGTVRFKNPESVGFIIARVWSEDPPEDGPSRKNKQGPIIYVMLRSVSLVWSVDVVLTHAILSSRLAAD